MFQVNKKDHKMETRRPDKYEVQHANTERFRKSSIIYMQHLLNGCCCWLESCTDIDLRGLIPSKSSNNTHNEGFKGIQMKQF